MTGERFAYSRCRACRTVFIDPVPADMAPYYEGDYYEFAADGQPRWRAEPERIQAAWHRLELVRRHVPSGHLIEIGPGTGAFAVAASEAGFDVSAIEMSESCCRFLSKQPKVEVLCSDEPIAALAGLPPADAVALWHVIEHLAEPGELIEQAARTLKPGGVLAVSAPNPSSLQFRLLGKRWMHLDAPRHLCLIPPETLVDAGRKAGLRAVTVTTTDPDGLEFSLLGWINALQGGPARKSGSWLLAQAGGAIGRALGPFERNGHRGAAVTVVLLKEA